MAAAAETFRLRHRVMNEVALANAEPVPGIHFDGQNADQGLNQPWPERNAGRSGHTAPAAEGCLLYTSPSPRDGLLSRMPSSA